MYLYLCPQKKVENTNPYCPHVYTFCKQLFAARRLGIPPQFFVRFSTEKTVLFFFFPHVPWSAAGLSSTQSAAFSGSCTFPKKGEKGEWILPLSVGEASLLQPNSKSPQSKKHQGNRSVVKGRLLRGTETAHCISPCLPNSGC